jgi:hypothetical protein
MRVRIGKQYELDFFIFLNSGLRKPHRYPLVLIRYVSPYTVIFGELAESGELKQSMLGRKHRTQIHCCDSPGSVALSSQVEHEQEHWKGCNRMSPQCLSDSQLSKGFSASLTLWCSATAIMTRSATARQSRALPRTRPAAGKMRHSVARSPVDNRDTANCFLP